MHDEDGYKIVTNRDGKWCIHSRDKCEWLSKKTNEWLGSNGCYSDGWAGWYKTKQEALDRLTRYKNGFPPKVITVIGGE